MWQHVKLSRSVPEIHSHVAGTLSNQQRNKQTSTADNAYLSTGLHFPVSPLSQLLVGLVVKPSASRAADPGFESRSHCGDFSGPSHTRDLKLGLSSGYPARHSLAGLVVKASASGATNPGFESRLRTDFSGSYQ